MFDDKFDGTFTVKGPVEVKGTARGKSVGDSLTIDLTYATSPTPCTGTMKLIGAFSTRTLAKGVVDATDSCVGKMSGTFEVGR